MDMMLDSYYSEFMSNPIEGERYAEWKMHQISARRKALTLETEREKQNEAEYYEE